MNDLNPLCNLPREDVLQEIEELLLTYWQGIDVTYITAAGNPTDEYWNIIQDELGEIIGYTCDSDPNLEFLDALEKLVFREITLIIART